MSYINGHYYFNEGNNMEDYGSYIIGNDNSYAEKKYKSEYKIYKPIFGVPKSINTKELEDIIFEKSESLYTFNIKDSNRNYPFKFFNLLQIPETKLVSLVSKDVSKITDRVSIKIYQYNFSRKNKRISTLLITTKNKVYSVYIIYNDGQLIPVDNINMLNESYIEEDIINEGLFKKRVKVTFTSQDRNNIVKKINTFLKQNIKKYDKKLNIEYNDQPLVQEFLKGEEDTYTILITNFNYNSNKDLVDEVYKIKNDIISYVSDNRVDIDVNGHFGDYSIDLMIKDYIEESYSHYDEIINEKIETNILDKTLQKTMTLYHGSIFDLKTIKPTSINMGTKLSSTRISSFWTRDYNTASIWAIITLMKSKLPNIPYVYSSEKKTIYILFSRVNKENNITTVDLFIEKISKCPIYVYTAKDIPTKYIGKGQYDIGEYTVDIDIRPDKKEKLTRKQILSKVKFAEISVFNSLRNKYGNDIIGKGSNSVLGKFIYKNPDDVSSKRISMYDKTFDQYYSGKGKHKFYVIDKETRIGVLVPDLKSLKESYINTLASIAKDYGITKSGNLRDEIVSEYTNKIESLNTIDESVISRSIELLPIYTINESTNMNGYAVDLSSLKYVVESNEDMTLEEAMQEIRDINYIDDTIPMYCVLPEDINEKMSLESFIDLNDILIKNDTTPIAIREYSEYEFINEAILIKNMKEPQLKKELTESERRLKLFKEKKEKFDKLSDNEKKKYCRSTALKNDLIAFGVTAAGVAAATALGATNPATIGAVGSYLTYNNLSDDGENTYYSPKKYDRFLNNQIHIYEDRIKEINKRLKELEKGNK